RTAEVAVVVASNMGVRAQPGQPIFHSLVDAFKDAQLLLILDNCERLIGRVAELAQGLLRDCPNMQLLCTSREPLRVAGERVYRVPPMTFPSRKEAIPLRALAQYEAVELFCERARSTESSFVLSDHNADGVAEVCRRLDGIPLAIEF